MGIFLKYVYHVCVKWQVEQAEKFHRTYPDHEDVPQEYKLRFISVFIVSTTINGPLQHIKIPSIIPQSSPWATQTSLV